MREHTLDFQGEVTTELTSRSEPYRTRIRGGWSLPVTFKAFRLDATVWSGRSASMVCIARNMTKPEPQIKVWLGAIGQAA